MALEAVSVIVVWETLVSDSLVCDLDSAVCDSGGVCDIGGLR